MNPESRIQNPRKALKAILLGLLLALPAALHAQDIYDWSYTGTNHTGTNYSASGTLTATTGDLVTNITGIFDGSNISALLPTNSFGGNDNLISPGTTKLLDGKGISFSTAGGNQWNLYYGTRSNGYISDPQYGSMDQGTFTLTAVPEPSSYAILGLGALVLVTVYRRRSASSAP